MASLIKGDELRERLQELLKRTSESNESGNSMDKAADRSDGNLSYTSSSKQSNRLFASR